MFSKPSISHYTVCFSSCFFYQYICNISVKLLWQHFDSYFLIFFVDRGGFLPCKSFQKPCRAHYHGTSMDLPISPRPSMGLPWEDCSAVPCAFPFRKATETLRGTEGAVQEVPLVCHIWCGIQTHWAMWIHDGALKSSFGNSPSTPPCALMVCSPVPMPGQCLLARILMQPCRFVKCLWGEDASTCTVSERLHDPAWWKTMKETWQTKEHGGGDKKNCDEVSKTPGEK